MMVFKRFQTQYRETSTCHPVDEAVISKYQDKLPAKILQLWREVGWGSYEEGLFFIDNPEPYQVVLEGWLGSEADATIAIGRTAFADLFLWRNGEIQFLDAQYGRIFSITKMPFIFFCSTLIAEDYLQDVLRKSLFDKALDTVGRLQQSQCYAFVPALALGGSVTVDNINIVQFREHSALLAQLQQ